MNMDYYKILGVPKNASDAEIKKAYKILVAKKHPDKFGNSKEAEKEFQKVRKAYDVLSDAEKRKMYDKYGDGWEERAKASASGFGGYGHDFSNWGSDFFSNMFDGFGGARAQSKGSDLEVTLEISLQEIANGTVKAVKYNKVKLCGECRGSGAKNAADYTSCAQCRGQGRIHQNLAGMLFESTCSACSGKGKTIKNKCSYCNGKGAMYVTENYQASIPKGMPYGRSLKVNGKGSELYGGVSGDLYIKIIENKKADTQISYTSISGTSDLKMKLEVNILEAILGVEKICPSIMLSSPKVKISILPGTDSGEKIKIRNEGLPVLHSSRRGDLIVEISVQTPKNLTEHQKDLLRAMDKEGAFSRDSKKSWSSYIFGR